MTTKTLEVVVCDLCRSDRPAVAVGLVIDVCRHHEQQIAERRDGQIYPCEQCDRTFASKQAVSMHVARSHKKSRKRG